MSYWDTVYEVIREVDNNNLHIYVNIYDLADSESQILVFDDWDSEKEFARLLKSKLENLPDVKKEVEDAIYDVFDREDWWIELAVGGYDYWTFSDEGFVCDDCYKWHYYNEHGAVSYVNYKVGDGYIICKDCIKSCNENMEEYLKDLINSPKNANTILDYSDFVDLDFDKVNDYPFANGWYHNHDNPEEILEMAKLRYPEAEFVFSIRKTYNPWETEFDLYMREVA